MIVNDFEKFMRYALQQNTPYTIDTFITFSTSLVNFYTGSKLITKGERQQVALELTKRFNAGVGNIITTDDIMEIANLIISDPTLDYSILNPIFGQS
ncbi:hypothetical protein FM107_00980 [Sphingobacterium sp. JB170]|nr:hypothetical protein FM107_00980 [Sphingobacterium sp. JB170]